MRDSGTGTISFYWIFTSYFNKFVSMHDTNLLEDQPIAWTPTPEVIQRAQLTKFMRQVGVSTWNELYEFSIRDVEKFTEEVLKFLDIKDGSLRQTHHLQRAGRKTRSRKAAKAQR
jgi:hypothetical protein